MTLTQSIRARCSSKTSPAAGKPPRREGGSRFGHGSGLVSKQALTLTIQNPAPEPARVKSHIVGHQPTLARLAQRTCSGSARERSQISLRNQTGIETAGKAPQVSDLLRRQHVEDEPSNLPEVNRTRLHQLPVALVSQLGVRRAAFGAAHSAHPALPLEARDHVR